MKKKSVFVYGPPGSGKSTRAEELMKRFGMTTVVDEWRPSMRWPVYGALILTLYPNWVPEGHESHDIRGLFNPHTPT